MKAPVIHKDALETMYREYFIRVMTEQRTRDMTILSFTDFVLKFVTHSGYEVVLPRDEKNALEEHLKPINDEMKDKLKSK